MSQLKEKNKVSRLSTATQQESPDKVFDKFLAIQEGRKALDTYKDEHGRLPHLALEFQQWVIQTRTTRQQFEKLVTKAIEGKSDNPRIEYKNGLDLVIDDVSIWFDSDCFKDYVEVQQVFGSDPADEGEWQTPEEILQERWDHYAEAFIRSNLHRAEIDESELEKL